MEKQHFSIEISEIPGGEICKVFGKFSPEWLAKALAETLKLYPQLLPVFLDATGNYLIGESGNAQKIEAEAAEVAENLISMFGNPKG